eukprot:TRINITY_DN3114_c0_g1_i1.p1 TRINITY_DN3114_c0_g1~~TRINITY_DN3114_c0_g1_i1.p1  ORF type:complete len:197 (-),score=44.48 TRINITY_DN3114_c0_g1_i1:19-609(-)
MPLVTNLKNPALRDRHWAELKEVLGADDFDPKSENFTLETLDTLGVRKFADKIEAISSAANKEQGIERAIVDIERVWESLELQMGRYKDVYYRLLSTEDLCQSLEDHQVQLATMRNSPFFGTFAERINGWVKKLSDIGDTVELVVQLTKQWMYLESIFKGSEEIRRQSPNESVMFDSVNAKFTKIMGRWDGKYSRA